ncbi:MAG TPA: hypothetical protein VFA10_24470 [Ktedonobacteraceae bacterium]|nr:hypothetical protein [Ktedonobacteraceae bacterium]
MSGYREEKFTPLLSFPYDHFLMLRRAFVQIVGNELEAKVLRIIEKTVEAERKRRNHDRLNRGGKVADDSLESTCDIWVPISYKTFMYELYETVASETTLKRALKGLLDKRLIFRRYQPHSRYDAPQYQLHVSALQLLLDVLGTAEGPTLIPSLLEGLKALPAQKLTPSECQQLFPSQACRGAETDPNSNKYKKIKNKKGDLSPDTLSSTNAVVAADTAAPSLDFSSLLTSVATLSQEQKQQLREALCEPASVSPAQVLPASAPLLQAEGKTVGVAEQEPLGAMRPASPSVPPVQALPASAALPAAEAEARPEPVAEQQPDEHPARAPQPRSEPAKETRLAERMEAVFVCLDKLAQQTTGDPEFRWTRSEKAKKAVKHLLADGRVVTPEKLSAVYLHMATMKPNPKTGFTWADKMSVTHVCENYDSIWLELMQAKHQQRLNDSARDKPPLRTLVVYGVAQQDPPLPPLPVVALPPPKPRRWFAGRGS